MECIICQDTGLEPLQDNTLCSCKYKIHNSCWIDYVHSKDKITCPLCRRDISVIPNIHTPLIQPTAPPYVPSQGQQISYQEFVEIVRQHTTPQNIVIDIPQPLSQPKLKKMNIINSLTKVFGILIILLICLKVL